MVVKREVFRQIGEKLFSVSAFKQKEFGKGDKKGRAKKRAEKAKRAKAVERQEAAIGKEMRAAGATQQEVHAAAQNVVKETGVKESLATTKPVKTPGSTPKQVPVSQQTKVPAKVQRQIAQQEAATAIPTAEVVTTKPVTKPAAKPTTTPAQTSAQALVPAKIETPQPNQKMVEEAVNKGKGKAKMGAKEMYQKVAQNVKGMSKRNKIIAGTVAGTTTLAGGAMLIKGKKKKEAEKEFSNTSNILYDADMRVIKDNKDLDKISGQEYKDYVKEERNRSVARGAAEVGGGIAGYHAGKAIAKKVTISPELKGKVVNSKAANTRVGKAVLSGAKAIKNNPKTSGVIAGAVIGTNVANKAMKKHNKKVHNKKYPKD